MRPLPRLHAITDGRVLRLADCGVRAAAIASAGSAVALHARDRTATGAMLAAAAARFVALARPAEASVVVSGRPDVARAVHAQGVQLSADDLAPADARRVLGGAGAGWVGRSVHSLDEARAALDEGADYLLLGTIYETASHPGRAGAGPGLVERVAALGAPVIAIGGVTPERVPELRGAGAYGAAAISALWDARDPAGAALALLMAWADG
jgi:thiamine-phosphate diphosphorylase